MPERRVRKWMHPGRRSNHGQRHDIGDNLATPARPLQRRDGRRPDRRPAPGPICRRPRRSGLRGPGGAARTDGRGHLPRRLAARARRRGCLPGHFPRAGPQGRFGSRRRRAGRLAAPCGVSGCRRGECPGEESSEARSGGIGDGDGGRGSARARSRGRLHRARGGGPAAGRPAAAGGALRPGGADLRAGRGPTSIGPSRRCVTGW